MSYSQEIQLKISADTTQASKKISGLAAVAEATGKKVDAAMAGNLAAAKKLSELRAKTAFNELNTIGKIKSITGELAGLVKTRNTLEQGSTKHLEIQAAILQRQTKLVALQRAAAKERVAGMLSGGGKEETGGGGGATGATLGSLVAGGLFKRLIFMGAGAVMGGIMSGVSGYFGRQAKRAGEQSDLSEYNLQQSEDEAIQRGGTKAEVTVLNARLRRSKEDASKLTQEIADMEGEVGFEAKYALNSDYRAVYEDKQQKLVQLKKAQADYSKELDLTMRRAEREDGIYKAQKRSVEDVARAQKEGQYSAVRAADIKLAEAQKVLNVLEGKTGMKMMVNGKEVARSRPTGTPEEIRQAQLARDAAKNAADVARMGMRERGFDVRQGLAQEVAGEQRTFPNGMPRPLSETERLAKQALKARQQARAAILTGAPGEAAYQQQRALSLESGVAGRLSEGSSQMRRVETTDATALSGKLETANQLLQAISNSLAPTQSN